MPTEWPCSTHECYGPAVVAFRFHDQPGHVHHCRACEAETREWYDVAASSPPPCPWPHGDGTTWVDYLNPLTSATTEG